MAMNKLVKVGGLALLSVFYLGLVGCSEFDHDHDHDSNDHSNDSQIYSRTSDVSGLPRGADVLDSNHGAVSVRTPDRGTVYVVDQDSGRTIWSGRVDRGDRVTVDPDNDRASVNGRVVYDQNLERKHRHAVYFLPFDRDRTWQDRDVNGRTY